MRRLTLAVFAALVLLPSTLVAQERDRAALEARRDSLEREVVSKFIERVARDLKLDAGRRDEMQRVLAESGVRRRALARESSELRSRIYRATRNPATSDAEFARLLVEHEQLRTREHDLWRREQEDLSAVLAPRQRAQFVLAWARFQDDMREIISRRMRSSGTQQRDHSNR